jgi:hypothetical protein
VEKLFPKLGLLPYIIKFVCVGNYVSHLTTCTRDFPSVCELCVYE